MPEMKSLTLNDKTYDCFVDSVARNMATWSALTKSASGENIILSDASNYGLTDFRVFGKTTQNGTPTPDAPVALDIAGSKGNIGVKVAGKNIFKYVGSAKIENGIIVENTPNGGIFQGNDGVNPGSTAWSSGWAYFDRAPELYLRAGTIITVSADYTVLEKHPNAAGNLSILLESLTGSAALDISNAEIGVTYRISRTIEILEDGKYKRTFFTIHSSKVKIENVQWEIGAVASDFVSYNEQGLSVSTPNGLPGIPVTFGGNYTDANGQQWICDEIDFARGVKIKRLFSYSVTGDEELTLYTHTDVTEAGNIRIEINGLDLPSPPSNSETTAGICSHFIYRVTNKVPSNCWAYKSAEMDICQLRFVDTLERFPTLNDFAEFAKSQYKLGTPIVVMYELETPIETPLSEEELAAYVALHANKDHTTVFNDAGAYMELEYVMDAKKYIDSLVGASARLSTVTLSASKWVTGADSLHSQVVTIDGITEYSKVDLLPSVEQLAIFHNKDVTFVTENEDGVVTVYAIGDKPLLDYTMQVSITEVVV